MSEFKITCPHCAQHIAYDESYWGVQIHCPACTAPIQISAPLPAPGAGGLRIARTEASPSALRLRQPAEPSPQPAFAAAGHAEFQSGSGWPAPEPLTTGDTWADGESEGFGMYEQLQETARQVQALPQFRQARPRRLTGLKAFFVRAGRAVCLIFTEKELITLSLLQWSVIGMTYYLWVQVLGWIPEETWAAARDSDGVSTADIALIVWSLLCIGLAALPLGLLSGCMGAVCFLSRQGEESTLARCFKIVLPHAFRLWIFTWIDAAITGKQILERLPKKRDGESRPANRALSEALYYAWKLGTAGVLPGLILGKGMLTAAKDSVLLVKHRFLDMALLRGGYSALCWVVGIVAYVGAAVFFLFTGFFEKTQGAAQGVQIHQFYQWAGVPILVAAGLVLVILRPLFLVSLCDLYAEEMETRGEPIALAEAPAKGKAVLVAFAVLGVIVATGGLYLKPFLKTQKAEPLAPPPAASAPGVSERATPTGAGAWHRVAAASSRDSADAFTGTPLERSPASLARPIQQARESRQKRTS